MKGTWLQLIRSCTAGPTLPHYHTSLEGDLTNHFFTWYLCESMCYVGLPKKLFAMTTSILWMRIHHPKNVPSLIARPLCLLVVNTSNVPPAESIKQTFQEVININKKLWLLQKPTCQQGKNKLGRIVHLLKNDLPDGQGLMHLMWLQKMCPTMKMTMMTVPISEVL